MFDIKIFRIAVCGLLALPLFSAAPAQAEPYVFQPPGCEFRTVMLRTPGINSGWRGENLITTATLQQRNSSSMRASCGEFYILDHAAFRKSLPEQLEFAARSAGIRDAQTEIRQGKMGTVASFWGYRGKGEHRSFYRSDTYVGDNSFLEIVISAESEAQHELQLSQLVRQVNRR